MRNPGRLTKQGRELLAKLHDPNSGIDALEITVIKVGDHDWTAQELEDDTAGVRNPLMEGGISYVERDTSGVYAEARLSNQNVTSSFPILEIGLYANDPDIGEIPYGISNWNAAAPLEWVMDNTEPGFYPISFSVGFGTTANIELKLSSLNGTVMAEDLYADDGRIKIELVPQEITNNITQLLNRVDPALFFQNKPDNMEGFSDTWLLNLLRKLQQAKPGAEGLLDATWLMETVQYLQQPMSAQEQILHFSWLQGIITQLKAVNADDQGIDLSWLYTLALDHTNDRILIHDSLLGTNGIKPLLSTKPSDIGQIDGSWITLIFASLQEALAGIISDKPISPQTLIGVLDSLYSTKYVGNVADIMGEGLYLMDGETLNRPALDGWIWARVVINDNTDEGQSSQWYIAAQNTLGYMSTGIIDSDTKVVTWFGSPYAEKAALNALTTIVNTHTNQIANNTTRIAALETKIAETEHFRGMVETQADLNTITNPDANDFAYVMTNPAYIWIYDGTTWVNTGTTVPNQVVPLSDLAPLMDGVATAGTANISAREGHVHPTDTSRAALTAFNTHVDQTATSAHGATTAATANRIALRDAAGALTATKYYGDGSSLTGIGAVSSADTTVIETTTELDFNNIMPSTDKTAKTYFISVTDAHLNSPIAAGGEGWLSVYRTSSGRMHQIFVPTGINIPSYHRQRWSGGWEPTWVTLEHATFRDKGLNDDISIIPNLVDLGTKRLTRRFNSNTLNRPSTFTHGIVEAYPWAGGNGSTLLAYDVNSIGKFAWGQLIWATSTITWQETNLFQGITTVNTVSVDWNNFDPTVFDAVFGANWTTTVGMYYCRGNIVNGTPVGFSGSYAIQIRVWLANFMEVKLTDDGLNYFYWGNFGTAGAVKTFQKISNVLTNMTGTLGVANGGTGVTNSTALASLNVSTWNGYTMRSGAGLSGQANTITFTW